MDPSKLLRAMGALALVRAVSAAFGDKEGVQAQHEDSEFDFLPHHGQAASPWKTVHDVAGKVHRSQHRCIGQTFHEEGDWKDASCYFRNVCYDREEDEFVYFQGDDEKLNERTGIPYDKFNTGVSREGMDPRGWMRQNLEVNLAPHNRAWEQRFMGGLRWSPTVRNEPIPSDGSAAFDTSAAVHLLYAQYHGHNIGHFLFDEAYPAFQLMSIFGLLTDEAQLLQYNLTRWVQQRPDLVEQGILCGAPDTAGCASVPPGNTCLQFDWALRTRNQYQSDNQGNVAHAPITDGEEQNARTVRGAVVVGL
jgi:hypothetical protein